MNFKRIPNSKLFSYTQFIIALMVIYCGVPTVLNFSSISSSTGFLAYWAPMHYNSALGLMILGFTLILMALKKPQQTRYLAVLLFALGLATMSQYLFKINLGIDEALRTAPSSIINEHPGRMAFGSTVCFTIVGFVIYILSLPKQKIKYSILAGLLSGIPAGIGMITVLSYAFETTGALNAGILSHMAVPTAFGFMMSGSILVAYSFKSVVQNPTENYKLGPIFFSVILFLGFLSVWQFLINEEQKYFHNLVQIQSKGFISDLEEKLTDTSLAIKRLASRTSYLGSNDKNFLNLDATAYLNHIKILNRIGLIDKNFKVIWAYPPNKSFQVIGFNQSLDANRNEALLEASKTDKPVMSRIIELRSGGKGFLLPVALNHKNDQAKFLYATIHADSLFQGLISNDNYQIAIYENGENIFRTKNFIKSSPSMTLMTPFNWNNRHWEVVVSPSNDFLAETRSPAPYIVIIGGGIISVLVGFFMQFISLARARDKKHNEERFIDSERIKAIVNSTNHSIIATDENGIILTFNTAAEKMLGYSKKEIIGKTNPGIFHDPKEVAARAQALTLILGEHVEPGFESFIAKTRKLNVVDENEWTYIRKDGSRFPISLSATALRDLHGTIVGYLGVGVDLTEHKKNQEQLKTAHERLERVIEATEEGIWERDFETKEIKFIDNQAKKVFGILDMPNPTYEQIVARINPADQGPLSEAIEHHVKSNTSRFNVEFRVQNPTDKTKWRWIRARGKVERSENRLTRLVSTVSDVTHEIENRIELEVALKAASDAALVKSAFLASMSHEIRTPLNGIIGMTDLLLETPLTEDQKRFADIVQNSGVGLLDLINDILDFSKIESGKLELENSDFSLPVLVENQTDLLMAKARKKKISLVTYIAPELPVNFRGDSGRIGQVILNLIGNAVKFTESGGVYVRASLAPGMNDNTNSLKVRFEIEDTGIGISEEHQAKLFKPFTQADNKISRQFGGTGLGLSISKQLIEAMNGDIGIISTPGKGSIFWFEISLNVTNHADFFTTHSKVKQLKNVRILIVENDALATDVIHRYISSWNMPEAVIAHYSDVQNIVAAAIASSDPFDIVIAGVKSANDEHFRLGRELPEKFGVKSPKLLAMTEFEWNLTDEEANKNGFFEVLKKPLKQSPLFDSIARTWSGEKRAIVQPEVIHAGKNQRILVADDVKTNRLLALSLLEKLGYSAHAVGSGEEVLSALNQMSFDLILMDYEMPEMNGLEATKKIRELTDLQKRNIPIVTLTADLASVDRNACLTAGMNGFLSKPLNAKDVQETLERLLAEKDATASVETTKLLLVDDHDENRTLVLHYLKSLPYSIEIAVDGQDALNKFKTDKFAIVLMDMQMPIMDGYEATKAIRDWEKVEKRKPAKIIALTANAMKEETERALKMGCDAHLSKPIRKQKLVDFLQQLVDEIKNS